ncbi:Sirohydrochlorin cobaltochelatase [compost metagenome]
MIAFYNPRSGKRTRQIEEARTILLRYRDPATPVGIVKNAYRDRQQVIVTTLQAMLEHEIGMLSTVVVGNSATTVYDGLMVTPRGYERKYNLGAETQALKPHERLRIAAEPWSLAAAAQSTSGSGGGSESRGLAGAGGTANSSAPVVLQEKTLTHASAVSSAVEFESAGLEVSPALGSRRYSGAQLRQTILLVGHGSRVEEGNEELRNFTAQLAARKPELNIETCFIELASPSIAGGIERCVAGGAGVVYVVPIILFAAGHSKLDIPLAIDQAKRKYPGVEFVYGRPVGVQERAVDILLDRLSEAVPLGLRDKPEIEPVAAEDTIVLVMGRGGSDPDANSDFYKLARLLWEHTPYKSVESCFIAIARPSLNEGLERCLALGARKIVVLPYLLFTGVLMKQFTERVTEFAAAHPEVEVELGSYIGNHPLLADMLAERIEETLEGKSFANCDNCRYRDAAAVHHHHHHGEEGHGHEHGHGHNHEHYQGDEHDQHHGHSHHGHSHGHHHGHENSASLAAAQDRAQPESASAETAAASSPKEL